MIWYNIATVQAQSEGGNMERRKGWMTVKEASTRFGYHAEYLRHLVREGQIVAEKLGTLYLIDPESVQAYINSVSDPDDARSGPQKR
jgi:excisionase family DNA binding protein